MDTGEIVATVGGLVLAAGASVKIAVGWVAGRVDKAERAKDESHARELSSARAEGDRLRQEIREERERSEALARELLDAYRLADRDGDHEGD